MPMVTNGGLSYWVDDTPGPSPGDVYQPTQPASTTNNPTGTQQNGTTAAATAAGGGGGHGGGGAPAASGGQYGDYALDSLHLAANGHLFGEKRVISGDPNNPGQSKYDYQTVDLGDSTTPAGIAAIAAATTIPVDMLNQQLAVLKDQNAQTAKGAVSSNFEYAGNFNGQDTYSATNPDGTRTTYTSADLVAKGWANQNDLDVIKQNYQYSQNKMSAAGRLQNVTAMGNGMYSVTNPDGSRTTMNGQQVIATQSATQTDLDLLDREKTQKDLDYARDTGLASKVSNISYAGNGQYSATDYYGAHGTYGANQLLTGQPAPPVPPQPPPTQSAAMGAQQAPPPATPYPALTQAQTPAPTPTTLPGSPNYAAPASAPTSTTSSAALGVTSSAGAGQEGGGTGPTPQMAGGGNRLSVQTGGSQNGGFSTSGAGAQSSGGGASPTGPASSGGDGSATQAELDQARNQWNQQQAAAYKQKLMGTSRSGVGMGFSGSQTATSFTGVQ